MTLPEPMALGFEDIALTPPGDGKKRAHPTWFRYELARLPPTKLSTTITMAATSSR